ncbi:reverse transcriptase, partial [Phytophthora megakarya]
FSLRQAKLHVNVSLPLEPAVDVADEVEDPEPMYLSSVTAAGQQGTRADVRCFRVSSRSNLLVQDLDDKFDMVLGMPWLARHDPIIDWEKRTVVRFGRRDVTKSDGADTPNGASEPPSGTVARPAVSGRSAWVVTTPGFVGSKSASVRDQTLPRNSPP